MKDLTQKELTAIIIAATISAPTDRMAHGVDPDAYFRGLTKLKKELK